MLLVVGLTGASPFLGDVMITPAISVVSAIERLELAMPMVKPYIVPMATGVLLALFPIQGRGSGKVGKLFGPLMVVWFIVLMLAGATQVFHHIRAGLRERASFKKRLDVTAEATRRTLG